MGEERQYHPLPISIDDNSDSAGLTKTWRDLAPSHYTLKIDTFSALANLLTDHELCNYESDVFEAGGYRWKLSLYPNGDKKRHGEGHISLYLVIEDAPDFSPGWEVNVNFKFFLYDQIQDKYLTIQDVDGKVRRFHKMKTEWGFAKLIPLSTFKDAANGFLISDRCVFGAEVLVLDYTGRGECVKIMEKVDAVCTWKIDMFSSLDQVYYESKTFTLGGRKWKLLIYPKGNRNSINNEFGLYLGLGDLQQYPEGKVYAEYVLRVKDQRHGKHLEKTDMWCFSSKQPYWGFTSFLPLSDLNDTSKGFLVNDILIIEAEVRIISSVRALSQESSATAYTYDPVYYY